MGSQGRLHSVAQLFICITLILLQNRLASLQRQKPCQALTKLAILSLDHLGAKQCSKKKSLAERDCPQNKTQCPRAPRHSKVPAETVRSGPLVWHLTERAVWKGLMFETLQSELKQHGNCGVWKLAEWVGVRGTVPGEKLSSSSLSKACTVPYVTRRHCLWTEVPWLTEAAAL